MQPRDGAPTVGGGAPPGPQRESDPLGRKTSFLGIVAALGVATGAIVGALIGNIGLWLLLGLLLGLALGALLDATTRPRDEG